VVQCGAVWCSVVQCGAVWCTAFQCVAVWYSVVQNGAVRHSMVQCGVLHSSVSQYIAVCCSVWQYIAIPQITSSFAISYGVASISRLLKIIGLFCKRALSKRRYSAKETYNFIDPTDRSHPIAAPRHSKYSGVRVYECVFMYLSCCRDYLEFRLTVRCS